MQRWLALVCLLSGCFWAMTALGASQPQPRTDVLVLNAVGDCAHPVQSPHKELQQLGYQVHEGVQPILRQGDLNFVNLENPITNKPPTLKKTFAFNAPLASLVAMERAGFNLFSLANNHMGDAGEAGIRDTEEHLRTLSRRRPLFWAGAGSSQKPLLFQLHGHSQKIAFLAWGNEDNVAEFNVASVVPAVRAAADQADIVLVSVHGGREYHHVPAGERVQAYRRLIDAGASVVLGHHPHVVQGIEVRGHGLIFYSLGNYSLASKTLRHHATGAKLYGMLPTVWFRGDKLAAVRITPLYVNNSEPLVVGNDASARILPPTPFCPQVAAGVFADHILDSIVTWSNEIPANATRFTKAGDVMRVVLPLGER